MKSPTTTVTVLCVLLIYSPALEVSAADEPATSAPIIADQAAKINKTSNEANSPKPIGSPISLIESRDVEDESMSGSAPAAALSSNVETPTGTKHGAEDQATSPSMTSVHHQVWTSSSSGSLDELSPEIISKLRSDVPFLAAYALRPRLVGASSSSLPSTQLVGKDEMGLAGMQTSASQQRQQRQTSLPLLGAGEPKLSDFSELKVETSSTSKSEHHHKRKTTLKKQPSSASIGESSKRRRLISATTSKLMKERLGKNKRLAKKKSAAKSQGNRQKSRAKSHNGRLKSQAGRLRRRMSRNNRRHHMSIIRYGRQQVSPAINKLEPESKTSGDEDSGVKGGSKRAEPFYKRRKGVNEDGKEQPPPATNDLGDDSDEDKSTKSGGGSSSAVGSSGEKKPTAEEDAHEDEEDGAQLEPPEPRRVGDPDVDEQEGDTVTVMPKFDGVDDDPEIPIEESEAPPSIGGGADDNDEEMIREREDGSSKEADDEEQRGKRVGRDKSEFGDDSTAAGGGIGATTGGNGVGGAGSEDETSTDGGRDETSRVKPGVEFADKEGDSEDDDKTRSVSAGGESPRSAGGSDSESGEKDRERDNDEQGESMNERPFDSRRVASDGAGMSPSAGDRGKDGGDSGKGSRKNAGDDDDDDVDDSKAGDVDYRDEMETNRSKGDKNVSSGSAGRQPHESAEGDVKRTQTGGGTQDKDNHGGHHDKPIDCDPHDHHDEHGDHHSHHDGIKWLQDAVPGEPGQDYPILSRANLTQFNCSDHKYAGYYADVDARCQVFHICQADGRQDSFLCPNGTIFSQISRVCVWWNSFDCEDAPKFYALNAQLYSNNNKQATSHRSSPDLRPLDGTRINPNDGTVNANNDDNDDDHESSIDSLIKSMKRRHMTAGSSNDGRSFAGADESDADGGPGARGVMMMDRETRRGAGASASEEGGLSADDEASIQRKSTKLTPADEEEEQTRVSNEAAPSRLRHSVPRRKRRASVRHSPPKLKSRRISQSSRKVKLRHRPKPKRRARRDTQAF